MVIVGIEEYKMSREVRVHETKSEGSCHGGKETSPHHLVREVVGDLSGEEGKGVWVCVCEGVKGESFAL